MNNGQIEVTKRKMKDLETRVNQFYALKLPGQPLITHMGTSQLVHDLWTELKRLYDRIGEEEKK